MRPRQVRLLIDVRFIRAQPMLASSFSRRASAEFSTRGRSDRGRGVSVQRLVEAVRRPEKGRVCRDIGVRVSAGRTRQRVWLSGYRTKVLGRDVRVSGVEGRRRRFACS